MKLLFDSGIRTGVDIVKALALGADAVLVGRPYVWGLALEGQKGVEHVLKTMLCEVEITCGLMGAPTIQDLKRNKCLRKVEK